MLTLRKKSPPAGKSIRWEPGNIFKGTPSLYHWIVEAPSALQFNVAGSCLGTVVSIGCSVMRGICDPVIKKKISFIFAHPRTGKLVTQFHNLSKLLYYSGLYTNMTEKVFNFENI